MVFVSCKKGFGRNTKGVLPITALQPNTAETLQNSLSVVSFVSVTHHCYSADICILQTYSIWASSCKNKAECNELHPSVSVVQVMMFLFLTVINLDWQSAD